MLVFTGFVLYGFVYPVYTRLGCCGHWKPDPDATVDTPSTAKIKKSPRYQTPYINRDQKKANNEELPEYNNR